MDRNQEYIRLLQEKNRMKKRLNDKTEEELAKEELERGFSTHFRGAHATKEPASTGKTSLNKPIVKVHTRAPPSDLIQRLIPHGGRERGLGLEKDEDTEEMHAEEHHEVHTFVRSGSRNGSRGGSRSASRYRNVDVDVDAEEEDNSDNYRRRADPLPERIAPGVQAKTQAQTQAHAEEGAAAAAELQMLKSLDLNNLLISHIQGLSAQQKIAMLELLQQTTPSSAPVSAAAVAESRPQSTKDSLSSKPTTAAGLPLAEDTKERIESPAPALSAQESRLSTPGRAPSAAPAVVLHVKIKVYSTWSAARNVALQGLRLRYSLTDVHRVVDLLHALKPRLQSGLSVLSVTHESMRSLPALLGQSPRTAHGGAAMLWRAPISAQNPLEIVFSGALSAETLATLCEDRVFDKSCLELSLWNGVSAADSDDATSAAANASPAKDVDVFVDEKCVWSGELPVEKRLCEVGRASDAPCAVSRLEGAPSQRVRLVQPLRVPTASVKTTQVAHRETETVPVIKAATPSRAALSSKATGLSRDNSLAIDAKQSDVLPSFQREQRRSLLREEQGKEKNSEREKEKLIEKDDRPEWLRGAASERQSLAVADSSVNVHRSFKQEEEEAFGDFPPSRSPSSRSLATQRSAAKLRRRRPRDGTADADERGITAVPSSPGNNNGSSNNNKLQSSLHRFTDRDREEDEENLRRSLEAVQHAEKFNLNRLESTLSKRKPRRVPLEERETDALEESTHTSRMSVQKSLDASLADLSAQETLDHRSHSRVEMSRTADALEASNNVGTGTVASSGRASKIVDMNSKLNNALTDLAEIMAALPRNRSDKRLDAPLMHADNVSPEKAKPFSPPSSSAKILLTSQNDVVSSSSFPPVEMPRGKALHLEIFSTHGDQSYVGLNGLDIYDERGRLLSLGRELSSVSAAPRDLSVLPGYEDDPRKVENLLDGVNATKDDLHQWLAPHMSIVREQQQQAQSSSVDAKEDEPLATVTISFASPQQSISMIRIHNFNKSRTHNQRGVKHVRLFVDNTIIFDGEIKRATGQMKVSEADSQLLLFTADTKLIEQVPSPVQKPSKDEQALEESTNSPNARPKTAIKTTTQRESSPDAALAPTEPPGSPTTSFLNELLSEVENIDASSRAALARRPSARECDERETSVENTSSSSVKAMRQSASSSSFSAMQTTTAVSAVTERGSAQVLTVQARAVRIEFDSTWGDREHVGLAGVEVLGIYGRPMPLQQRWLAFDTSSDMFGSSGSGERRIDNVLSRVNNTANDSFMWLAPLPYEKHKKQYLEINFPSERTIVGLRFWNFNGSFDATLRGCKHCTIFFDDRPCIKYLLRPGPECDGVEFSQTLLFDQYFHFLAEQQRLSAVTASPSAYITPKLRQVYEAVTAPTGLLWKFSFFSNHGDDYYIGMDAIDIFDAENQIVSIPRRGGHVAAVPHSVRDLSSSASDPLQKDPRTPDKLFAKCFHSDTASSSSSSPSSARSCWLAPLAKCMTESEREVAVTRSMALSSAQDVAEFAKKKRAPLLPRENVVMLMFAYPVSIAAIRMFNYSKSVRRGVKDFAIHVDGKLVFMGSLLRSDEEPKSLPEARSVNRQTASGEPRSVGQAVVLSQDLKILNAHKDFVPPMGMLDQDVLCINERQVMVRSKTMYEPPNSSAIVLENPNTDLFKRPTTSFFS